jgi:hypothetical protein
MWAQQKMVYYAQILSFFDENKFFPIRMLVYIVHLLSVALARFIENRQYIRSSTPTKNIAFDSSTSANKVQTLFFKSVFSDISIQYGVVVNSKLIENEK